MRGFLTTPESEFNLNFARVYSKMLLIGSNVNELTPINLAPVPFTGGIVVPTPNLSTLVTTIGTVPTNGRCNFAVECQNYPVDQCVNSIFNVSVP